MWSEDNSDPTLSCSLPGDHVEQARSVISAAAFRFIVGGNHIAPPAQRICNVVMLADADPPGLTNWKILADQP